jgi:hypothetical protein
MIACKNSTVYIKNRLTTTQSLLNKLLEAKIMMDIEIRVQYHRLLLRYSFLHGRRESRNLILRLCYTQRMTYNMYFTDGRVTRF